MASIIPHGKDQTTGKSKPFETGDSLVDPAGCAIAVIPKLDWEVLVKSSGGDFTTVEAAIEAGHGRILVQGAITESSSIANGTNWNADGVVVGLDQDADIDFGTVSWTYTTNPKALTFMAIHSKSR